MFFACFSGGRGDNAPTITFGKRYPLYRDNSHELSEGGAYIFNANGTGCYEFDYVRNLYNADLDTAVNVFYKGRIDFVWRVLDDGSVCFFEIETTYYEGHTKDFCESLNHFPIYFGEDLFVRITSGGSVMKYIVDGSSFAQTLTK